MAETAVERRGVSVALACRAFGVSETCYRYSPNRKAENEVIADLLTGLTDARKTWGFGLCFLHLRNVKGHPWNHKRAEEVGLATNALHPLSHCNYLNRNGFENHSTRVGLSTNQVVGKA